ncbi:MAG: lipid-A-disaccharide synthase [Paracoccus sp. (in: a-proteobacteria)]|uniref:lipid-A-disaccharide synthase n=1 Tax=Paracoccus sp. TaxID=267 RepID=UPI0026E07947|nr:lipid-A-disaccharide synthase [Paracoccus sp. (in: a-proteobacteria)]MDO5620412.1 lipid-A-disaccharide synthase [Paracoccus sp. (in: a-proteobacteria)]
MKVFLIAGEASGDRLGAALMAGLRELVPGVSFDGVGGPLMQAQGLVSRFPMSELSVMGLAEILPKYFHLKRRIRECADAVIATRPDVLITIDAPDFGLRVARLVRAAIPDQRTVHYVAPSVWAWRPGRAAKMARVIDHVLTLLPFEPPLMQAAGMSSDFVGHPVVSETRATPAEAAAFRAAHGVSGPLLLMLPGSRGGEVARLGPRFGQAAGQLAQRHPGLRVAVPVVPHLADRVADMARDWPDPILISDPDEKRAAFAAADLALAASGTVSLELAANGVPMVIGYDAAWLTRVIVQAMLRVDTVTLVNLVSETRVVPEYIGPDCNPPALAAALDRLLSDPAARAAQQMAMEVTMNRLGRGGEAPGLRAARSVLGYLSSAPRSR